ncbi:MAG: LacI family transcriptional regulator, partial [Acidobacteria bacterium]
MKQVSIKDIARVAQVSHPTVSRALRHSPLVNPETAEKIRQIADTMGYRANAVARGLVTKKTWTIGAVVTTIADPFIGEVASGVEELANDNGYSVILANCNADPDRELRVVRLFEERRVDGILILSSRVGALYMPLLSELRVPIVLINSHHPDQFAHSVMIDNLGGSLAAVQHLIQLGHRRIAYLGEQYGLQSDTERYAGYRQALVLADFPFTPELVVHANGKAEGSLPAMNRLLALDNPPTAVFCYNDLTAIGALRAIRLHGLRVPDDISVVGFDDLAIASYTDPPLTTVRQPKQQMGRMAVEILCNLISGAQEQTQMKVPGELIVRESTCPARVSRASTRGDSKDFAPSR